MDAEALLDRGAPAGASTPRRGGPLAGVRVVEFAGLGPPPFASMLMADLGADVLRLDRPGKGASPSHEITSRSRRYIEMNLKSDAEVERALSLLERADVLIEGFRPGVMERLGLGPDVALARNPRLVYARMTGWGQTGPLAHSAGHDINYIAITGALGAIGPSGGRPSVPLNLVGDYGGGALYLVVGVLAALLSRQNTGRGQVIDCAMCDGVTHLMALFHGFQAVGEWQDRREANLLDGGAHFYGSYECADGRHIAIGALEPQFYAELCSRAGIVAPALSNQNDRKQWPALRAQFASLFIQRTRDEWCAILEGTDSCFAPVLMLSEAPQHPHLRARETYIEIDGVKQAAPAPRFSLTPAPLPAAPPKKPTPYAEALSGWSPRD